MLKSSLVFCALIALLSSCSLNNVKTDDSLGKYFTENKVEGCFGIMDNGTGQFTVYNLARYRDSSFSPASTFKIVNALIGLQTGVISSDTMLIKWDGVKRRFDSWNKDLTMYQAFRESAVPYFQEVARRIGKDTMQRWLNTIKYGATSDTQKIVITSAIDTFWLDNSLKITPDQQVGLVKKLYFEDLPVFFKSNQRIVKNAMLMEDSTNFRLGYKTGWNFWDEKAGKQMAWVVGWIEENKHPYFFVLNFETKDPNADIPAIRIKMLKDILRSQGFFEGRM